MEWEIIPIRNPAFDYNIDAIFKNFHLLDFDQ